MKRKNKLFDYCFVILLLLLFSIMVFYKTLFKEQVFAWYNDQLFQHNVFYKEWYRIIKETINTKVLSVYSWNTFLGTDYLASKLMYCVGDFLITPFFIFYNGEINFDLLFAITTIICIVLSGTTMLMYLEKIKIDKRWILLSMPVVYALGGFAMTYTGSYMFHRFYSILPLLFYFTESYIQENKKAAFIIVVAILFLQSYELLFSTCFFLILYFIISNKLQNRLSIKDILKKSIPLILSFLIGISLCGLFLIPLILYLKSNPRVGSLITNGFIWNYKTIVGIITNIFIPSFNFRSGHPSYLFYSNSHYNSEYGLFITSIIILAVLLLIKKGNKEEKRILLISELILFGCLLIKPLNSIIHGFSVPSLRWSFLIEIYNIMLTAYVFNKYNYDINASKQLLILLVVYVALYVIFILIYKIDLENYRVSILINISSFLIVFIYDFLLRKSNKLLLPVILINICVMYALSIFSTYGVYKNGEKSYEPEYLSFIIDNDGDLMERYYFYSEELWPYSWLNLNDSINNDYMGVTTYDSTYNSIVSDFLIENGFDSWMVDMNNPKLQKLLGVKYIVTTSEIDSDLDAEYYTNLNNYNVYKINDYNHIGYTFNKFVKNSDNKNVNYESELSVKDEDFDIVSNFNYCEKKQLEVTDYGRQYFRGKINIDGDTVLFVATPFSEGWNIYDQNERKLKAINVDNGFLGVIIDSNVEELSFYYSTPGLKMGLCLSLIGLLSYAAILFKKKTTKIK